MGQVAIAMEKWIDVRKLKTHDLNKRVIYYDGNGETATGTITGWTGNLIAMKPDNPKQFNNLPCGLVLGSKCVFV